MVEAQDIQREPGEDVISVLLRQHQRIRDLLDDVTTAEGLHKKHAFDELRALLAAHETAEEMILRPQTVAADHGDVADRRNQEEYESNVVLAELEKLSVTSPEFDERFAPFRLAVLEHAENEEREEFPVVTQNLSREALIGMGRQLVAAERIAPTHPHPSTAGSPMAQWTVGPIASVIDRVKDAIRKAA